VSHVQSVAVVAWPQMESPKWLSLSVVGRVRQNISASGLSGVGTAPSMDDSGPRADALAVGDAARQIYAACHRGGRLGWELGI
jgi:hypothetical protein